MELSAKMPLTDCELTTVDKSSLVDQKVILMVTDQCGSGDDWKSWQPDGTATGGCVSGHLALNVYVTPYLSPSMAPQLHVTPTLPYVFVSLLSHAR